MEADFVVRQELTPGQLNLIARSAGLSSGRSLIDVGCGNGSWLVPLRQKGWNVAGLEEKANAAGAGEFVSIGSPAATVPWQPHSQDAILFRGTSIFTAREYSPELMIGLANLGSSLKARGHLLIPLTGSNSEQMEANLLRWKSQLSVFPGTFRSRLLTPGILHWLTLAFLSGPAASVTVIDFQVGRQLVSRLEWHQLARTAVMSRLNSPAVA